MSTNLVKFIKTNSTAFLAAEVKDENALYFLEDTGELYKGSKSYSNAIVAVGDEEEFPAKGAINKLYFKAKTGEGKYWDGHKWQTVINPIAKTIEESGVNNLAVTGDAVKAYVTKKFTDSATGTFVTGITYDKENHQLNYVKHGQEQATSVPVEGFVSGVKYEASTGTLKFEVAGDQTTIDINLPKDNFVSSGSYDPQSHNITLVLSNGGSVVIPAADLVDTYLAQSTNTVDLQVQDNTFKANVKISATEGNQIQAKADGLFVPQVDISGKVDKASIVKTQGVAEDVTEDQVLSAAATKKIVEEAKAAGVKAGQDAANNSIAKTAITNDVAGQATDKVVSQKAASDMKATLEREIATAKSEATNSLNKALEWTVL